MSKTRDLAPETKSALLRLAAVKRDYEKEHACKLNVLDVTPKFFLFLSAALGYVVKEVHGMRLRVNWSDWHD